MTKPTQAQIERLRAQFQGNHWRILHRVDSKEMSREEYDAIEAALTAAAEVGRMAEIAAEREGQDAEREKNAINDLLGGFDNYALGFRISEL